MPLLAGMIMALLGGLALTIPGSAPRAAPAPGVNTGCPVDASAPKREFRAMWIATVSNIDWPSRPGLSEARVKAEFLGYLDLAVRLRFNAVIVQIRPGGDAFWPSRYEPWSRYLTGVPGKDPGWDPLAFMITEAHRRNLQFHAWFNPYRVGTVIAPFAPARRHPDWIVRYGGRMYYNPGVPAARAFVEDAIMDAVSRYDVDGVHFDDYFYPYPGGNGDFPDAATFAAYHGTFTDRTAWRRNNIDLLIQELNQRVHLAKPWAAFGVSPFGIWRNRDEDPAGSATNGNSSYAANSADTREWVQRGWIDYIVPQLYWNIGFPVADYAVLVKWWADLVKGTGVQLYIGQADYRVGVKGQPAAWQRPDELARHLALNQRYPAVTGDIYFSAQTVRADRLHAMARLVATQYRHPALVPVMSPVAERPPPYPDMQGTTRDGRGVTLTWRQSLASDAGSFAVYRFDAGKVPGPCDFADANHLIATVSGLSFTDTTARPGRHYTYYVTALDRYGHESTPGSPATV